MPPQRHKWSIEKKFYQKKFTTQDSLCDQSFREKWIIFKIGDFFQNYALIIYF